MVAYQELQCHPEAELFYPGAKVYQRLGESESSSAIGGSNPAFSGAILISSDSVSQIYKWYDAWLTRNGWYRAPLLGAGYVSAHGYARTPGREAFNVDIDNPAQLSATLGQQVPAGGTLFEVRYILFQASQTPHTPAPSCPTTPEPRGLGSTFYCNP